ncbi:hypothetical protein KCP69_19425 [Salmonella enterica subsp. enterica]|nr:hypothetical protein KCP69_19425 [Salmonella enterica subsp. enterica]
MFHTCAIASTGQTGDGTSKPALAISSGRIDANRSSPAREADSARHAERKSSHAANGRRRLPIEERGVADGPLNGEWASSSVSLGLSSVLNTLRGYAQRSRFLARVTDSAAYSYWLFATPPVKISVFLDLRAM